MGYTVRNNELYIRALEFCPECIMLYIALIGLTLCVVAVTDRTSRTSVKYASRLLPYTGYYFNRGFHQDNEHYIKSDSYVLPVILYGVVMLLSIATLPMSFYFVEKDVLPYLFAHSLIAFMLIALFIKYTLICRRMGKHSERLCLLEICRVVNDPHSSVLVFFDRRDIIYELHVEEIPDSWQLNGYYEAICYGETIREIETTPTVSEFLQYDSLKSNTIWYGVTVPIICVLLGLLVGVLDIAAGAIIACVGLLYLPLPKKKKMYVKNRHYTAEFTDLRPMCTYTFTCIDKHNNVYYYQSDDLKAVDIGVCFDVQTSGRIIKNILSTSDVQEIFHYRKKQRTRDLVPFYLIMLCAIPTCCICGWYLIALAIEMLMTFLHLNVLFYIKRGAL